VMLGLGFFLRAPLAHSEEESLNFSEETPATTKDVKPSEGTSLGNIKLGGRVDLSYEIDDYENASTATQRDTFKTNHFVLTLIANPSEKVKFMGEFINQYFYQIDYHLSNTVRIQGGKILMPFGNPDHFHKFYGGLVGFGTTGSFFPLIWAEHGVNVNVRVGDSSGLDTYLVNSISQTGTGSDPSFSSASNTVHQAFGARYTLRPIPSLTSALSAYAGNWAPGKALAMGGFDIATGYGLLGAEFFKSFRFATGIVAAQIWEGSTGDYLKRADYIELASNLTSPVEARIRYGTVVANSDQESQNDTQTFAIGAKTSVDAIGILVEYQWNFEAVNEIENDLFRIMASLDF